MFMRPLLCRAPVQVGSTEVVYDNLNPDWAAQVWVDVCHSFQYAFLLLIAHPPIDALVQITVTYLFEVAQQIIIRVSSPPTATTSHSHLLWVII